MWWWLVPFLDSANYGSFITLSLSRLASGVELGAPFYED
jgi:hypothetical protein